ncbi:MAG TPA: TIGR00730 family Rossman fold protein [Terriglobales bacterium]|nr:TIGR00730 family Rossman fold protein [Terriglobales bacterium]
MKRICVFCGSSTGVRSSYARAAVKLGRILAGRKIGLVYGGGNVGLMGLVADSVLEHGGEVIGVIPRFLVHKEVAHQHLKDLRIVESMHQRKALMADLSDGFIALPGGFGTLEEFCEVVTWTQLQLHPKACGLLNVEGFYDPLLRFLDHAVKEQFLKPSNRKLVRCSDAPEELVDQILNIPVASEDKWISRDPR